jgi:hypothetical protein
LIPIESYPDTIKLYEAEKKRLQDQGLSAQEYERKIKQLAEALGV